VRLLELVRRGARAMARSEMLRQAVALLGWAVTLGVLILVSEFWRI
jgi:hypothetical protein